MSRYEGRIKVVDANNMCWPVDPTTLQAVGVSYYDAYAWSDPELGPLEQIHEAEWLRRKRDRASAERGSV